MSIDNELRGETAEKLIAIIEEALKDCPVDYEVTIDLDDMDFWKAMEPSARTIPIDRSTRVKIGTVRAQQ